MEPSPQPLQNAPTARRSLAFSDDDSVEISISTNGGACFGVVRAVKLGHGALDKNETTQKPVYSLGPIVHDPRTVESFLNRGTKVVADHDEIHSGTVILRSHGAKREVEAELRNRGVEIVDATCPLVKKPQRIAAGLSAKGYFLVAVGDEKHPEVVGVLSYYGKPTYIVTYKPEDIASIPAEVTRVGVVAQTTIQASVFDSVVAACRARFKEVAVYNTICDATSIRQTEAEQLAQHADVFVVVGGRNSSNTAKLVKIAKSHVSDATYLIERKDELMPEWFLGKRKIAVTGGAATPQEYVDEVGDAIASLMAQSSQAPALQS